MFPVIGLLLVMLVLPIALMVWSFSPKPQHGRGEKTAPPPANADPSSVPRAPDANPGDSPLRSALEHTADDTLKPTSLAAETAEVTIKVADVQRSAKNLGALAGEGGGTALIDEISTTKTRVLVSLPRDQLADFLRRAQLATGAAIPFSPDNTSGMLGITLVPAGKP